MLEQNIIQQLAKSIHIAGEHIAREAYEIFILHAMSETPLVESLVFKGGTALRLAYGSPRFSEDLDFSLLNMIDIKDVEAVLQKLSSHIPKITIADISSKHFTYFALLKVKEPFLSQVFSIKIEISKRLFQPKGTEGFKLSLLESPTSPLTAFIKTMTLSAIFADKKHAVKERIKPRDLFDLWFLGEKLKQPMPKRITGFDKTVIKQELNKFLPVTHRHIVDFLIQTYGNTRHSKTTKRDQ